MPRTTAEEQIRRLEAKIQAIKERAERSKLRTNRAVKPMSQALRSIDMALGAADDPVLRRALDEARATVATCLASCGVTPKGAKGGGPSRSRAAGRQRLDAESVLAYLEAHQGQRSEQITAELGTNAAALRAVVNALIENGRVRTEGERRGRRYFAAR